MAKSLVKIKIGGVPEHFNLPWKIWLEASKNANSDIEWIWEDFPGGSGAMLQALSDNSIDLALVLTEAAANALLQNADLKALSIFVQSPLVWGIFSGASNPIDAVQPVAGKKYAISRFGSGSHLMARLDAKARGEVLENEQFVVVQNLDGAKIALESRGADLFFWEKWMTKPLVDQGVFKMIDERPTPWPCFVLVSKNAFWNEPAIQEVVKNTFEAVLKIASDLKHDPNGFDKISSIYGLKPEDAKTWLHHVNWANAWQDPENEINKAKTALTEL